MIVESLQPAFVKFGLNKALAFTASYAIIISAVILLSLLANMITKRYIYFISNRPFIKKTSKWIQAAFQRKLFYRLSHVAPALVIYASLSLLHFPKVAFTVDIANTIGIAILIYMIWVVAVVLISVLDVIDDVYHAQKTRKYSIKSYLQIISLLIYLIAGVLIVSVILDKSPLVFFTGLGAMTAILMVVFKDTIMGLLASIQNAQYDIMHIGDWIEIPQYGVDGEVKEMSLNIIKVQNFDKTIVSIPSQAILQGSIKNWRGMHEFGARRIKRSVNIDIRSIKFCTPDMLEKFEKFSYLSEHIKAHAGNQLTNIGVFRAYLQAYLKKNKYIKHEITFLVRHLSPTEKGLPMEIYVFANDTDWNAYENIQADIFDHVLAIIPEFELKIFQNFLPAST